MRTTEQKLAYFANDTEILVQSESNQILIFDQDGYIKHREDFSKLLEGTSLRIVSESVQTEQYGKYFLLKDVSKQYSLIQVEQDSYKEIMG